MREVEVKKLRSVLKREQDVARLDVAVEGLTAVGVIECVRQDHADPGRPAGERTVNRKPPPTVALRSGGEHRRRVRRPRRRAGRGRSPGPARPRRPAPSGADRRLADECVGSRRPGESRAGTASRGRGGRGPAGKRRRSPGRCGGGRGRPGSRPPGRDRPRPSERRACPPATGPWRRRHGNSPPCRSGGRVEFLKVLARLGEEGLRHREPGHLTQEAMVPELRRDRVLPDPGSDCRTNPRRVRRTRFSRRQYSS